MTLRRATALVLAALAATPPAIAQGVQPSPVLTLDQDRMYSGSLFGKRVQNYLREQSIALSQENRKIELALEEEERRLTDERSEMSAEDFETLAVDFDERVTGIRAAQGAKADNVQRQADAERARFFEAAFPVLLELVEETGAVAILSNTAVIFSVRQIDITDAAIARIDAAIGDAAPPEDTGPLPVPRPSEAPEPQDVAEEPATDTDN